MIAEINIITKANRMGFCFDSEEHFPAPGNLVCVKHANLVAVDMDAKDRLRIMHVTELRNLGTYRVVTVEEFLAAYGDIVMEPCRKYHSRSSMFVAETVVGRFKLVIRHAYNDRPFHSYHGMTVSELLTKCPLLRSRGGYVAACIMYRCGKVCHILLSDRNNLKQLDKVPDGLDARCLYEILDPEYEYRAVLVSPYEIGTFRAPIITTVQEFITNNRLREEPWVYMHSETHYTIMSYRFPRGEIVVVCSNEYPRELDGLRAAVIIDLRGNYQHVIFKDRAILGQEDKSYGQ